MSIWPGFINVETYNIFYVNLNTITEDIYNIWRLYKLQYKRHWNNCWRVFYIRNKRLKFKEARVKLYEVAKIYNQWGLYFTQVSSA